LRDEEDSKDEIRLRPGDDLALICEGRGDPEPKITWTRKVNAKEAIFGQLTLMAI